MHILYLCSFISQIITCQLSLHPKPILGLRSNTNNFEMAESGSTNVQLHRLHKTESYVLYIL